MVFPFRNFEIDHVIPRAKGGPDHIDNLQLLCGACNRAKGTGTHAELIAKLKDRGQTGSVGVLREPHVPGAALAGPGVGSNVGRQGSWISKPRIFITLRTAP